MTDPRASDRDRSSDAISRRRLLAVAGTAGLGSGFGSIATGTNADVGGPRGGQDIIRNVQADDGQGDAVGDLPLFDAHTHLIPHETLGREPLSADGLVSWMDEQGIDRAVVQALDSPESYPVQAPSWWVLEQVESSSDRLIPFCSVDPRTLVYGAEAVENLLEGYDNLYGDLSAGSGWNALTRDPEFGQGFLEDHHEQLVWGSDYIYPS
jgi:predicted TIM-barrel fold metal-dependent hydrolase